MKISETHWVAPHNKSISRKLAPDAVLCSKETESLIYLALLYLAYLAHLTVQHNIIIL